MAEFAQMAANASDSVGHFFDIDARKQFERDAAFVHYVDGANIAGFVKVADAMSAQGVY